MCFKNTFQHYPEHLISTILQWTMLRNVLHLLTKHLCTSMCTEMCPLFAIQCVKKNSLF